MVFVPLATISMGTLHNEQIGNASGLFNLMRNVGGGIGISMVNTLVARHQQIHRSQLVQNLAPANPGIPADVRRHPRIDVAVRRPGRRGSESVRH